MKKLCVTVSLAGVAACALLVGCSKSRNATSGSAPVATDSTAPVEMKIKWTVGKRYDQEFNINQAMRLDLPNMPKPMDQTTLISQDYSISALKDLPDGGQELELRLTGMKMDVKLGDKPALDFDSSRAPGTDSSSPIALALRKVIGANLKYDLDSEGKVAQVIGLDDFVAKSSSGNAAAEQTLKSLLSADRLKQLVTHEGMPDKPVKIGDQWPLHLDMNSGQVGDLAIDLKFTFTGWQQHNGRKCALLESTGTIATKAGTSEKTNGAQVSIDKGTIEGSSWYDPEKSMVVDSASDQDLVLRIVISGKTTTTHLKQTMNYKLVDMDDITN